MFVLVVAALWTMLGVFLEKKWKSGLIDGPFIVDFSI